MKAQFLLVPLLLIPAAAAAQTPPESPASPQAAAEAPPPPPPAPPPASDTSDAPMPVQAPAPVPTVEEAPPDLSGPRRAGFTIETSLGIGSTMVSGDGQSESFTSLAGLDIGVGGFVTPSAALTLRITGTTFFVDSDDDNTQRTSGFFGPSLQVWVNDHFFVGGGAGLALYDADGEDGDEPLSGFGLDGRVGYGLVVGRSATLYLSGEITPSFFDEGNTLGLGVKLGVQLF